MAISSPQTAKIECPLLKFHNISYLPMSSQAHVHLLPADSTPDNQSPSSVIFPPKEDPASPPLMELDTTVDSSIKHDEGEYHQDLFFIALNSQPDGKSQSYRIRFYSDDTSSLPILEIMSRFHGENGKQKGQKESDQD